MKRIVPHLWYDKEAKEAALFYISLFEKSKLLNVTVLERLHPTCFSQMNHVEKPKKQ